MLIKFTKGGRGGGGQVAEYLTSPDREGRDHAPPEVVRGDMDRTRELIDSIDRQWTYTHGVLSFALEDAPSEAKQQEAMDAFEALAFAGLDREQWDITWVRHQHTEGGRVELHFVVPRMELTSGKALNIAPPGWESTYAPLRDALNWENGWARPDDPERATELQGPPERLREGLTGREGREALHSYLTGLVAAEQVTDRASMVQALQEAGLEVPRQGRDYLTVQDPESGEKWRMKGRIYEKGWTYDRELDRAVAKAAGEPVGRDRGHDLGRAEEARHELAARMQRRAEFHAGRYPRHDRDAGREPDEVEAVRSLVVGGADRDVAGDRGLVGLALDAPRTTAGADVHERGADIPGPARRGRGDDLHEGRAAVFVRETSGGDLDDGATDSLRALLARTVRDTGARLRDRAGRFGEDVRGVARAVIERARALGPDRAEATRDRGDQQEAHRALEQADRSVERSERCNRELGEAGERLAQREAVRERATRERGHGLGL